MVPGIISLLSVPRQSFSLVADGKKYLFSISWNQRNKFFTVDLEAGDGAEIVAGKALVHDYPISLGFHDGRPVPFVLFLASNVSESSTPVVQTLKDNFTLYLVPREEKDALGIAHSIGVDRGIATVWDAGETVWDGGKTEWDL